MDWTELYRTAVVILGELRDPMIVLAVLKYIFSPRLDLQGINHSLAWIADTMKKAGKRMGDK